MLKISLFILYFKQAHSRTYTDVAAGTLHFIGLDKFVVKCIYH